MSEKSIVMTNGASHTIAEQLKKPSKVIFQCDDGRVLEFNSYEEIYDRLNKLGRMEKQCEVIYDAYHHGTEEELDKSIQELILKEETDWSDEE